tara:strand:+ start:181 stop:513 length:333 start_codon:yes stop_codon:yes gene_type:complete
MKRSDKYLKLVEWSEEDDCYIGRCPELMLGGVHGSDEKKVYSSLCKVVEEWIDVHDEDKLVLPQPREKDYSGKFILRVGDRLHELLSLKALQSGDSLNSYCKKALERQVI